MLREVAAPTRAGMQHVWRGPCDFAQGDNFFVRNFAPPDDAAAQYSCLVGRNRISLMSTSSGWLSANTTVRANESAGIATS